MQTNHINHEKDCQLRELILRAQAKDQQAFEALLDRYAPLIDSMTNRFTAGQAGTDEEDDLHQEAMLGFYNALLRFDTEQDQVHFGLYAKECIRNRLISHLRKLKKHRNVVLMENETTSPTENNGMDDPADLVMERESYTALCRRVEDSLSPYENRIWWLYLSGRTAKEIAATLGKDERSVQNAVYRIRRKLRSVIPYS